MIIFCITDEQNLNSSVKNIPAAVVKNSMSSVKSFAIMRRYKSARPRIAISRRSKTPYFGKPSVTLAPPMGPSVNIISQFSRTLGDNAEFISGILCGFVLGYEYSLVRCTRYHKEHARNKLTHANIKVNTSSDHVLNI